MSQGFRYELVRVTMSSWDNDMSAYMVAASKMHHGSYVLDVLRSSYCQCP